MEKAREIAVRLGKPEFKGNQWLIGKVEEAF